MATTDFTLLTDERKTVWSRDVWKVARNTSFLTRYLGTGSNSMIQRITEMTKTEKGDRAVITLVPDSEHDGVAGDRTLKGNEAPLDAYDRVITIDQLRKAHKKKGRMADQRSIVNFRKEARDQLGYWLGDRIDQMAFLMMSGVSFSKKTNGADRDPEVNGTALMDLDFATSVTAPSTNRHRRWDATDGLSAGDTTAVAAVDVPSWEMLVEAKAYAKRQNIKPMKGAEGLEVYNVFMSPEGMAKLKLDTQFLQAMQHAAKRGMDNPLFKGADVIYVDGLAIREFKHVYNTTGAASGSKWGAGSAIDGQRIILAGAQALAYADLGTPEWIEEDDDYKNQMGIAYGKIFGLNKPVFQSAVTGTDEDFGLMVIDTAI